VNYRRKVIVATPGGIGAYTQSSCQLSPYLSSPASDFPRGGSGSDALSRVPVRRAWDPSQYPGRSLARRL